jgi:small subunit ribosomal protein S17e
MGNVRTSFVKRTSRELIETHSGVFTRNFEENKKLVSEKSTVSTKHLRNKIAGYITRLIRQQEDEMAAL